MARSLPALGDLDHRVEIHRLTGVVNAYNEPVEVYALYATFWASRTDSSAGEAYRAREVGAELTARFAVRYSPQSATITPKDRLVLESGGTYNITAVREVERNQWLEIDAVVRAD
jgi:SPP1 family predicted phage head-tail adaptor